MRTRWVTEGFADFSKGSFGNGGQNIYVSNAGVLQRIYQYDLNHNGYFDLVFANCQNHHEIAPSFLYRDPLGECRRFDLPGQGTLSGAVTDLTGSGFADIILCGHYDMAAPFASSDIYFGSEEAYSEKRHIRIPTPWAEAMVAGNFNHDASSSLAFAMPHYRTVRLFYPTELGIEWSRFIDLPIEAELLAAGDLNGDGCDELITCMRDSTELHVYWGGEDGIKPERHTVIPALPKRETLPPEKIKTLESDMERKLEAPRLPQVIMSGGQAYLTISSGKKVIFYHLAADGAFAPAFALEAPMALAVAAGDINGDGFADIAVACRCRDPRDEGRQQSFIYWGGADGWSEDRRTNLATWQACDVAVADLDDDGFAEVVFCQGRTEMTYTNDSLIFRGGPGGLEAEPLALRTEDAQRVFAVSNPEGRRDILFVNHYARSAVGFDKTYIYYGSRDGYSASRREEVPSWCAVDSLACDLDDDGWAELVVCNNSENSLHLDPGSHVHHFGPEGFQPGRSYLLPTTVGWGAVCADFDHDGWLDLVFVCNHYRDLKFFHGSREGFTTSTLLELKREDGSRYGSPRWIYGADLNKDGWLDLVIPLIDSDRSLILWGGREGYSLQRKTEMAVQGGACARVADLSRNGYPDLIIGTHTETPVNGELTPHYPHHSFLHIYWNGPEGIRENNKSVLRADACDALCVADFDRDGWLDIFACSYHGGKDRDINSYLYWNKEGVFHEMERQLLFTHSASGSVAADFNEDGWTDLAVANHKVWGDHRGFSSVWWNGREGFKPDRRTDLPTCGPHGMTSVEPGNQLDRGPEEYYISPVYRTEGRTRVLSIAWEADIPEKTWVRASIRAAESAAALETAPWSEYYDCGQPLDENAPAGRYYQYKLALGALNSLRSPRVNKVIVDMERSVLNEEFRQNDNGSTAAALHLNGGRQR